MHIMKKKAVWMEKREPSDFPALIMDMEIEQV